MLDGLSIHEARYLEKAHPLDLRVTKLFKRANFLGAGGAALALAVAGTAVSVSGNIQQGKAAKAKADFQSQVAKNNAIVAQRNADDARQRGRIAAGERDLKTRQQIGRQRVSLAASGQEVDTGSGLEITSDSAALGKLDSLRIVNNSEREAAGLESQSANFAADASVAQATGKNAVTASRVQAFGSLVSGASSVAGKWSSFKKAQAAAA